jgi:glycosyltransferase involved in cell wall biosynthesis
MGSSQIEGLIKNLSDMHGVSEDRILPLVSIIITTFNYEGYIAKAIASVAAQTYKRFECIIVDDCSTDETEVVIKRKFEELDDPRFSYVRNAVNLGQLGSLADGLTRSRGSFIVSLDADDLLAPAFVERHLHCHLNTQFPVGFSASDSVVIDGDGALLSGTRYNMDRLAELTSTRLLDIPEFHAAAPAKALLLPWNDPLVYNSWVWGQPSGIVFRRTILELIIPPPERCGSFRICADAYFVRFAHLVGNSMLLFEKLGAYRVHSRNGFAIPGVVAYDSSGGDASKIPSMQTYADLGLFIMKERQKAFRDSLGSERVKSIISIFESRQSPSSLENKIFDE